MKRLIPFLFLVCSLSNAIAQGEANFWYFGTSAAVDFNSGAPVSFFGSTMGTYEGCAAISTSQGNLLFYTDGVSVWDKNNQFMPNGNNTLQGNSSSTQSGIIVPRPGNPDRYYVFSVMALTNQPGLTYSEVDMTLNSGLGDLTGPMNVQLPGMGEVSEKVVAIQHANGVDYWVVAHKWETGEFHAFLVTSAGISNTAVVSNFPTSFLNGNTNNVNSIGYMKGSPCATQIAVAAWHAAVVEVFDFDNTTGQLSNLLTIPQIGPLEGIYGIEFSPNGELLYACNNMDNNIYQFNLALGSPSAIINSQTSIGVASGGYLGSLQLAPDNKIYLAKDFSNELGVINNPNVVGPGCNYVNNGFTLTSGVSRIGFPNFIAQTFKPDFGFENVCEGDTTFFHFNDTANIDSVLWNFGDPGSGINNEDTVFNPFHIYTGPGTYTITLISYSNILSDTLTTTITILPLPVLSLPSDTTICEGDSFELIPTTDANIFLWSDSTTGPTLMVDSAGTYWVSGTNGCGATSDTIIVSTALLDVTDLGADTTICDTNEAIVLDATSTTSGATYVWQDNTVTTPTFTVSSSGDYSVTVSAMGCTKVDSINVLYFDSPQLLGNDTVICPEDSFLLQALVIPGADYLWQDSTDTSNLLITQTGTYHLVATIDGCTARDTIIISGDSALCVVGPPGPDPIDTNLIDSNDIDCIVVVPNVITPNGDGVNDLLTVSTSCEFASFRLLIYNRWGGKVHESTHEGIGWDGTADGMPLPRGTYFWVIDFEHEVVVDVDRKDRTGSVTLFR